MASQTVPHIDWTVGTLRDAVMAFEVTLGRVPRESMAVTPVVENWDKVQLWLAAIRALLERPDAARAMDQVPPFPLSGQQLRALQASVDRIAQAQAAASATLVGTTSDHLHTGLAKALLSSYLLAGIFFLSLIATAFNLFLFRGAQQQIYVGANLVLGVVGAGSWIRHHADLLTHRARLREAHPLAG